MKNGYYRHFLSIGLWILLSSWVYAQQQDITEQDVPEPVFLNFSIQPPYIPTYDGRDPFKPLTWFVNQPQISIAELEYHGVVDFGGKPMALFGWRTNQTIRFTLKGRKLYSDADIPVDGVVGDITDSKITLIQGDQKIVYPRKKE